MKIVLLVEGKTERVFIPYLRKFLEPRLAGKPLPRLSPSVYDGRIPKEDALRRRVELMLAGRDPATAVVALTDVYTGTSDFKDANDARQKMAAWVGRNPRFFPHAAQHDFEAWLIPFWPTIQRLAGHNRGAPPGAPESINHGSPPSYKIKEIFRQGSCRDDYSKTRDAARILENNDLTISARACPELKAFLNTLLRLAGGELLA
ncbi:MAG: DUF4276 family protein [Myxococcales bacterium]|nr:DUF4276 family protein [Myxococcales bacterium]